MDVTGSLSTTHLGLDRQADRQLGTGLAAAHAVGERSCCRSRSRQNSTTQRQRKLSRSYPCTSATQEQSKRAVKMKVSESKKQLRQGHLVTDEPATLTSTCAKIFGLVFAACRVVAGCEDNHDRQGNGPSRVRSDQYPSSSSSASSSSSGWHYNPWECLAREVTGS